MTDDISHSLTEDANQSLYSEEESCRRAARGSAVVALRERLLSMLLAHENGPGEHACGIPGFTWTIRTGSSASGKGFYKPACAFVLQGSKKSTIGERVYAYGEGDMIVTGVDVPAAYCATTGQGAKPFVGVAIELSAALFAELLPQLNDLSANERASNDPCRCGFMTCGSDEDILACFLRLAQLLDHPREAKLLAPIIMREIHMRLLLGPNGAYLRGIFASHTRTTRVRRVIRYLQEHFDEPYSLAKLAGMAAMSTTNFQRCFREVTQVSPLQYQKRLRLLQAQRLMIAEGIDAASAGFRVGYKSPAQFSRDYVKFFEMPPKRHVAQLRQAG